MRYVLLIYGSEALAREERATIMRVHPAFLQEVQQRGLLAGGAALQTTSSATTVRVRDGKTMITDGPFAETKEQLAGFYILDCKDLDEAIAMAARVPDAVAGSIEILCWLLRISVPKKSTLDGSARSFSSHYSHQIRGIKISCMTVYF